MSYLSVSYALLIALLLPVYYGFFRVAGGRFQWVILLLGSLAFCATWVTRAETLVLFLVPVIVSYCGGILLEGRKKTGNGRGILALSVVLTLLPLLAYKLPGFAPAGSVLPLRSLVFPVGISFYSLQLTAYLVDCWRGDVKPRRHFLKFMLFVTFFPQIIQGPIPRYRETGEALAVPHSFVYENLSRGLVKIVWGFFLKLMIADRADVFVSRVFEADSRLTGGYILLAACLYSVQLYADFRSCTSISRGTALLFGIELPENFRRPYFALSVSEFWRRWHISLSSWLRDYVYIPLGGSRKGAFRKAVNILITFLVSGLWHGADLAFLLWGLLHAVYQIAGSLTSPLRNRVYLRLGISEDSALRKLLKHLGVFLWVTLAWVFFRAGDAAQAFRLIEDAFRYWNPWSLFGTELYTLGLDIRDFQPLFVSVLLLFFLEARAERGGDPEAWLVRQHTALRWAVLILAILCIWVFGAYGFGFNAQDFIYGGF